MVVLKLKFLKCLYKDWEIMTEIMDIHKAL